MMDLTNCRNDFNEAIEVFNDYIDELIQECGQDEMSSTSNLVVMSQKMMRASAEMMNAMTTIIEKQDLVLDKQLALLEKEQA